MKQLVKMYWLFLITLLSSCILPEPDPENVQTESFIKFFESGEGIDLLETEDNGFICLAVLRSGSLSETSVIKTDINGNTIWIQKFNSSNFGGSVISRDIKQLPGGGYMIVGDVISTDDVSTMLLILLNQLGDTTNVIKPDFTSSGHGLIWITIIGIVVRLFLLKKK